MAWLLVGRLSRGLSMIRRIHAFVQILFLLIAIYPHAPARAAFPAIVLAAEVAAPIVVHSVGRAATMAVGVAANDATFASAFAAWSGALTAIGAIVMQLQGGKLAEIQMKAGETLTQGTPVTGVYWKVTLAPGTWNYQDRLNGWASTKQEALNNAAAALQAVTYADGCEGTPRDPPDGNPSHETVSCNKGIWTGPIYFPVEVEEGKTGEQPDNIKRVLRDGQSFRIDQSDPDWDIGPVSPSTWAPGTIQYSMPSEYEIDDIVVDVEASGTGVALRAAEAINEQYSSVKVVRTDVYNVPTYFEQVAEMPAMPWELASIYAENAGTGTNTGGTVNVEFPSDYARQGEAQAAAQLLKPFLENSVDVPDPYITETQFTDSFFKETFKDLLSWQLPNHTSMCPTSSFSFNGQSFTIDSHCQLINDHWSVFQTVMSVVYVLLAMFIVLRA